MTQPPGAACRALLADFSPARRGSASVRLSADAFPYNRPLRAGTPCWLSVRPGSFMDSINSRIANELGVRRQQVAAAVALLDEGSTVPFIARYRKEVTGSLDDTQLRHLEERLRYLRELDERRASILASIEEPGK